MANNFAQADATLANNNLTTIVSSLECVQGKIVIPSGGAIKVKKDSGSADCIVSLLTDVA